MKYDLERLNIKLIDMSEAYKPDNTVTPGSLNKKHINNYLKTYAPNIARKKRKHFWVKYLPYVVLIIAVGLWVLNRI
jgi:hypothetical protein